MIIKLFAVLMQGLYSVVYWHMYALFKAHGFSDGRALLLVALVVLLLCLVATVSNEFPWGDDKIPGMKTDEEAVLALNEAQIAVFCMPLAGIVFLLVPPEWLRNAERSLRTRIVRSSAQKSGDVRMEGHLD